MPFSVDKLYFESDVVDNLKTELKIEEFNKFLNDEKMDSSFFKQLEKTFEKISPYFNDRFVKMDKNLCFDKNINGCWLGLCDKNWNYGNRYNSGVLFDKIVDKELIQKGYDAPTRNEILKLSKMEKAPFELHKGAPKYPYDNGYILMLYKIQDNYKKLLKDVRTTTNCCYGESYGIGYLRYIYRLHKENSFTPLTNKQIFILWIHHKLTPLGFEDEFYKELLNLKLNLKFSKKDDKESIEVIKVRNIEKLSETYQTIDIEKTIDELRKRDTIRANLLEYEKNMFLDINKGSWEVFYHTQKENFIDPVEVRLNTSIVAKDPNEDIKEGLVAIDFGTKSTVIVFQNDREVIKPMRIGVKKENWHKAVAKEDFENPTILGFKDFESFLDDYENEDFRPFTNFKDVTMSHYAYEDYTKNTLKSDNFNAYVTDLKQWAGDTKRKIKIEDYQKNDFEFEPFLEIDDEEVNPIEIYAYYIGLYVNNQINGIYTDYLLSFPVTYEKAIRDKILFNFKKGLTKSIPKIDKEIVVKQGVSEPAAYAAVALQKYGLAEENEKNFYAIFDFGGGTTDFDFGIFRWSDEENREEEGYDYVIEHFGAGGDRYLGGENLLELLAFNVFMDNLDDVVIENKTPFSLPSGITDIPTKAGIWVDNTRVAKQNMVTMTRELRRFWEREDFESEIFTDGLKVTLLDKEGTPIPNIEINVDEEKLLKVLEDRIQKGVDNFFEAIDGVIADNLEAISECEDINIFLAGNSSKSPLVQKSFDKKIEEELGNKNLTGEIKVYQPLDNSDNFEQPNGKTGVAFGLIETRKSGNVLVIDKNIEDDIKFKYYLGMKRRKFFQIKIDRNTKYFEWQRFINAGRDFEIYYTSLPLATTGKLEISDSSIKKLTIKIEEKNPNEDVYIRLVSPTKFEWTISKNGEVTNNNEIYKIEIKE